ncbi:MAG: hypothetical protein JOY85_17000 [Acidobacteriaceae bacterium]|nr:hypothetical protein [Acidobacteriaceae bacterium]
MRWVCIAALLAGIQASSAEVAKNACASCHPKESARWAASAMGQSMVSPAPLPSAHVVHELSQSMLRSEQHNGQMVHTLSEQGLTAEYPVRYQIGGDFMGRTYLVQVGDYLFESPLTYFNRYGWDLSPGYSSMAVIGFDRQMDDTCLFCHADSAQFVDDDRRRLKNMQLAPLSCDRCHGSGQRHVQHPSAQNIVNPAKLPHPERDSICEQCHLEGATRILNPGKQWDDFHPGEKTEATFSTYVLTGGNNTNVNAVNHVEQLAQSKCVRATAGKLWCGSCHNPHGETFNRAAEIKAVCTGCHKALSPATHPASVTECATCHMPSGSTTDIPHAARTDHRILRRPTEAAANEPANVMVWRDPPREWRDRNLGLAEVFAGVTNRLPHLAEDGWHLLNAIPEEKRDVSVLSDFEGLALQNQNWEEAVRIGRRTVELRPRSAKAAMNLGIVFKRSRTTSEAERELKRAIGLDPSLKQAYLELATLYVESGRTEDAKATIGGYLKFNPQDIMFRWQRQRLEPH